jgi:hypothetical protein
VASRSLQASLFRNPFLWLISLRNWQWCNGDIGAERLEAFLGEASDGEKILEATEGAALLAETHDGFRRGRADSGKLLEFLDGGGVQVEGFFRKRFFGLSGSEWQGGQANGQSRNNREFPTRIHHNITKTTGLTLHWAPDGLESLSYEDGAEARPYNGFP